MGIRIGDWAKDKGLKSSEAAEVIAKALGLEEPPHYNANLEDDQVAVVEAYMSAKAAETQAMTVPKSKPKVLRRSDLPTLDEDGRPIVNMCRFLKQRGLPSPVSTYRVTHSTHGTADYDAVDESAAIATFCRERGIKSNKGVFRAHLVKP